MLTGRLSECRVRFLEVLTSSMLVSLGDRGVPVSSTASSILTAAGVPGVLPGRLLDFRCMGSRMDGLSALLLCMLGVSTCSCGKQTLNALYLLQKWMGSRIDGLSALVLCRLGVSISSCGRQTLNACYLPWNTQAMVVQSSRSQQA